ncbi:tannase/feruloyl esterase family alpha/beta hydrolase [Acidisphaera sp. L21]|uniref:tannase/feruloyl esterase family alpha/beta hydrolase n=1 Tax=Acidisphaera sp. L21 TaxID=1641851 RepID=UPI00131BEC32|nr:tannase/feruloyl esterase family alpha/beta hydrolase [Acidisphaera sp. L21]
MQTTSLPGVSITAATTMDPGFTPPGDKRSLSTPFCRVIGVATPVAGSRITFEVWLPPAGTWNGKFRGEGSGGSAGTINYPALVDGLARGYATMANDNGHTGSSWTFAQNPEAVVDFGYRAQHVSTVDAKAIVQAFYGTAPRHAYFVGCSQGGHHAQMEAQRYPQDYDGILAGDPASNWIGQMLAEVRIGMVSTAGGTDLPQPQLDLVTKAVLAQCAAKDGGAPGDQFLNDPRACHPDLAALQCKPGQDGQTCLSAAQMQAVQVIHDGTTDPSTGQKITAGMAPGSEAYWRQVLVGTPLPGGSSTSFFRDGIFNDAKYDFSNFNFARDTAYTEGKLFADQTAVGILDANNTNLEPFRQAGGKLIMYHGWADPFIAPQASIDIYAGIVGHDAQAHAIPFDLSQRGNAAAVHDTQSFARLFMVPGLNHCTGGPGVNSFGGAYQPAGIPLDRMHDMVDALDAWVDHGIAPDKIIAAKYTNNDPKQGLAISRPLCPYPQAASYDGTGNPADAASFSCAELKPQENGPPLQGVNSFPNAIP